MLRKVVKEKSVRREATSVGDVRRGHQREIKLNINLSRDNMYLSSKMHRVEQ